jgi:hypothetical protein
MAQRAPGTPAAVGPNATVVFWRYSAFWVLFMALLFFIALFGVVAEA